MKAWIIVLWLLTINVVLFYTSAALIGYYQLGVFFYGITMLLLCLLDMILLFILYRYPLSFLNLMLMHFPINSKYRTYHAMLYIKQKRYELALRDLNRAIKLEPTVAQTYYYRGIAYIYLNQYQLALQDCDQALAYNPRYSDAYYSRGSIYFGLKKYDQALENLNQALLLSPNKQLQTNIYKQRGAIYQQIGEHNLAIQDFREALALFPKDRDIYTSCAIAHIRLKEYQLAIQTCNQSIELDIASTYVYDTRAVAYLGLNNIQQANIDLTRAWQLDPQSIACGWHREWIKLCQEKPNREISEHLNKLAAMGVKHKLTYVCRGVALWIKGANDEALQELDQSIQFEPIQWDAHFWQGMAYASLGRDNDARAAIQAALAQGMPAILLSPLRWLEKDQPEFYQEFALPLLASKSI